MKNFVVTTNVKVNDKLIEKAEKIAEKFHVPYVTRQKMTINDLIIKFSNVLIVYSNELVYVNEKKEKLFFHLDTAMVRIKNNNEPLIELIEEKNQKVLDITMGLARDSVVLSYFGHNITALESNEIIHYIVATGLKNYDTKNEAVNDAMRRITTYNVDNLQFLKNSLDNEYDVIYLDPMFNRKIKGSDNLSPIENLANRSVLTDELFAEIRRVAKKKIIIKAHNSDTVFEKYKFKKIERPGAKFSFGSLEKDLI